MITNPTLPATPIKYIGSLIFGENFDETFPKTSVLSRAPGDLACVKITHLVLGRLIQESDLLEEHLHVELYPNPLPPNEPHAEIWMVEEWKESNARNLRIKELSQATREINGRRDEIIHAVSQAMSTRPAVSYADAQVMGERIAAAWGKMDISAVLASLRLVEVMEKFK
jgi:hypothetical protein